MNDSPRDIRHDLRERLGIIAGRYADAISEYEEKRNALDQNYRETIKALDHERAVIDQLLQIEESRHGGPPADVAIRKTARLVALGDFLVTKVHAHGPLDKDQLRQEATLAGYFADGNGRKFHTTLMNITNGGRLIRLPDGRYAFPQRDQTPLFEETGETDEPKTLM
jgi:hypothetical protein